jgi:hypothetical protein
MSRRVFLTYQHRDHGRARGFNLMRYAPNSKLEYSVRHLLSPVNSDNEPYISSRVKAQMKGTSVTVVLIGRDTHASDWCAKEIRWSQEKQPANGLLGIRIDPDAPTPQELLDCGADVLDWNEPSDVQTFEAAIERAALAAGRGEAIAASASAAPGACAR